jgi:hypothetical protein
VGIESGAFPLIIFMGVGALTDFGPLLANPKTLLLGAAAQHHGENDFFCGGDFTQLHHFNLTLFLGG